MGPEGERRGRDWYLLAPAIPVGLAGWSRVAMAGKGLLLAFCAMCVVSVGGIFWVYSDTQGVKEGSEMQEGGDTHSVEEDRVSIGALPSPSSINSLPSPSSIGALPSPTQTVVPSMIDAARQAYCGVGWDQYAALHARILRGEAPQRYIVLVCKVSCGGLGNRMYGVAGLFYIALATDAALLIDIPSWNAAFAPQAVDWSASVPPNVPSIRLNWLDKALSNRFFADVAKYFERGPVALYIQSNLGLTTTLWDIPMLAKYGINELVRTPLGCALNYILALQPAVLDLPCCRNTSVHVRIGDVSFKGDTSVDMDLAQKLHACIGNRSSEDLQFFADSENMRQYLAETYRGACLPAMPSTHADYGKGTRAFIETVREFARMAHSRTTIAANTIKGRLSTFSNSAAAAGYQTIIDAVPCTPFDAIYL